MELKNRSGPSIRLRSPSRVVGGIQGARNVQIREANISVVAGDSHTHTHVHYQCTQNDLKAILNAISNLRKIQQDTLAKATPGTIAWLFKTDYFVAWWDNSGGFNVLWGTGIPGAGKTVVAAIVINEIERRAKAGGGTICVAYYYLRYSERSGVTVRSVLEVLIKQSIERHQDLLLLAAEVYQQHIREGTQPSEDELIGLLAMFIGCKAVTCYILDALDESPVGVQLDLIQKLASLNARIFVTSRPMKDVQACFSEAHCFEIAAHEQDLDLYINKKLQSCAHLQALLTRGSTEQKEQLIATVKAKCGGMFLHASLQLDALQRCLSFHSVMETLEQFPAKIEDVYEQTWTRITNQDPEHASIAKAALLWVLHAKDSLTIDALCRAIATCPISHRFEEDRLVPSSTIIDLCHGLLALDEKSRLVRLVHYTAKSAMEKMLLSCFSHPHTLLVSVCMAHLTARGFQNTSIASQFELRNTLMADPLLAYAHSAWAFHAQQSLREGFSGSLISDFIVGCRAFPGSFDGFHFDLFGPLHVVAVSNLQIGLAGCHTSENTNIRTKLWGATPLILACTLGHYSAASSFLSMPDVLVNSTDSDGDTALMQASRRGFADIVELLLSRDDIEVNAAARNGDTALILASRHCFEGIVELLLAHSGTRVNLTDSDGNTALMLACSLGFEGVVQRLLAHPGIKVNLKDANGYTALMQASWRGHGGSVALLLADPNIEVNQTDSAGNTALVLASQLGHEEISNLLLARIQRRRQSE